MFSYLYMQQCQNTGIYKDFSNKINLITLKMPVDIKFISSNVEIIIIIGILHIWRYIIAAIRKAALVPTSEMNPSPHFDKTLHPTKIKPFPQFNLLL
jgi:hypothetical protein